MKEGEMCRAALKFGFMAVTEETSESLTWHLLLRETIDVLTNYVKHSLYIKKFWEELIAYFPSYDTGHTEKDESNNSSIVTRVFVTAVTFVPSRCLATIEKIHRHTHTYTQQRDLISLLHF
jgi:hypothetical protein